MMDRKDKMRSMQGLLRVGPIDSYSLSSYCMFLLDTEAGRELLSLPM